MGNRMVLKTEHTWLGDRPLKPWYKVVIIRDPERDVVKVEFHSRIHINPVTWPSFCWSTGFTDQQILKDHNLITWVIKRYGADIWW